ncbi:Fe-S oxidoreductase [Thermogutta terrifontis]|uniref:Fe-S oxidoreductase n=1 Tax=Thermogutta terrifontis TaxID=1331910 RepID=A0A286RDT3_9BACT|nr:(Fe-S)-binding protein [Thermogutta terrifontis]ASV74128.1 Fe-S oxidoreductase [Thermogutta terrifontis]
MSGEMAAGSSSRIAEFYGMLFSPPEGSTVWACMQCGLCASSCPLGDAMEYTPRRIIAEAWSGTLERVIRSPSIWMCVGCYTCSLRCPRQIDLTDTVWPAMRDYALQEGIQPPSELRTAFQNLYLYGNVFGHSPRKRLEWTRGLEVTVRDLSKSPEPVEVLWLVGCYPSYHPRNQVVAREMARILTALGIRWGILGKEERALGDCDRLFGEEGLFEMLVESNRRLFERFQFEKIVLLDPHAFRALEKFYPRFGAVFPAEHYTTFLASRLEQLRPWLVKRINARVTYHDNCCVGRRCRCFDAPRKLLTAIPGIELVEMERNREHALCCGGGGGGMWLDAFITQHGGRRLSDVRVQHALKTGAEILAVSCPFELSRFEDAVKVAGAEDRLRVRDILELLAESMGLSEGGGP